MALICPNNRRSEAKQTLCRMAHVPHNGHAIHTDGFDDTLAEQI